MRLEELGLPASHSDPWHILRQDSCTLLEERRHDDSIDTCAIGTSLAIVRISSTQTAMWSMETLRTIDMSQHLG